MSNLYTPSKKEQLILNNKFNNNSKYRNITNNHITQRNKIRWKNRLQNKKGDWFQYKDCESGNVWKILFNSDTRDLWILVQYPDMAGDEPPCNKKKK